jgi:hypothetical protein
MSKLTAVPKSTTTTGTPNSAEALAAFARRSAPIVAGFGVIDADAELHPRADAEQGSVLMKRAMISPFSGTTVESTTCRKRQPRNVAVRLSVVTALVASLRARPSSVRVARANFVNELLLSINRNSAAGCGTARIAGIAAAEVKDTPV